MAVVSFLLVGDTANKAQLKGAIEEALKSTAGTVILSANPVIGAALHALFEDIVEAGTNPYGDYDEMDDEEAPDDEDQENMPADNPNPACDEECVDQEPEEGEGEYEYTPLEYAKTLTEDQCELLRSHGIYFLEEILVMDAKELHDLGPQRTGIVAAAKLWQMEEDGVTYSAEIK